MELNTKSEMLFPGWEKSGPFPTAPGREGWPGLGRRASHKGDLRAKGLRQGWVLLGCAAQELAPSSL